MNYFKLHIIQVCKVHKTETLCLKKIYFQIKQLEYFIKKC